MARLSDVIEAFIKELMDEMDGAIELQRNELANRFKCVPSQINYVIDTRFTNRMGYYVESRRGGGGYIKIRRVNITTSTNSVMHIVTSMGDKVSQQVAEAFINNFFDYEIITKREAIILKATMNDKVFTDKSTKRDEIRASILKSVLMSLLV